MTEKYDELSVKEPMFGELRNLMDLCVIAALISKENMLEKASLELPTLLGQNDKLQLFAGHAPQTVATQCSFVKRSREFLITASGGVDITSWQVADKSVTDQAVSKVRGQAAPKPPAACGGTSVSTKKPSGRQIGSPQGRNDWSYSRPYGNSTPTVQ